MAKFNRVLRSVWELLPESRTNRLRRSSPYVAVRDLLRNRKWGDASHDEIYDDEYFKFVDRTTKQSADVITETIMERFHPASVFDVGCGTGVMLESFRSLGVRVRGLEYAEAALAYCRDRQLDVEKFDIASESTADIEQVDLVVSMEVGQQLRETDADRYVDLLCRAAPVVIFSSESPGWGDKYPRNEKPHQYWIEKFCQRSYSFDKPTTLHWRSDWKRRDTAPWFARNVMIFQREHEA